MRDEGSAPVDRVQRWRFRVVAPDGRELVSPVVEVRHRAVSGEPGEPSPSEDLIELEIQLLTFAGANAARKRFRLEADGNRPIEGRSDDLGVIHAHVAANAEFTLILPDYERAERLEA